MSGLSRAEISCLELILINRSGRSTGRPHINLEEWIELENDRFKREAQEDLEPHEPMTLLELRGGFRSLKERGMVEESEGLLRLWPIERPAREVPLAKYLGTA